MGENSSAEARPTQEEAWPEIDDEGFVRAYKRDGRWVNWWARDRPSTMAYLTGVLCCETDRSNIPTEFWGLNYDQDELSLTLPLLRPHWLADDNADEVGVGVGVGGGGGGGGGVGGVGGGGVRATWIGHATVLAEVDGTIILTDPIFSDRAFAVSWLGPRRYRPPACSVAELPSRVDAVVISHSHYDHLDLPSARALQRRFGPNGLHWYVPHGLKQWMLRNVDIDNESSVHEMVWWEEHTVPGTQTRLVFTPADHWSARTPFDDNLVLWGTWTVIGPQHNFFFGGDTAYAAEAFKQIGEKFGPFNLAAIPIGAYEPNWFMKFVHVSPAESVKMHEDIRSRHSFGIHWGTFKLTSEFYLEPRTKIEEIVREKSMPHDEFEVVNIGQTVEKQKTD